MNLQKLRNYLISSCRYIQTEAGIERPEASAIWVEWVVARSLCVFRSIDMTGVDSGALDSVLRLKVREWAPFAVPEYHFRQLGSRALVWAWDGALRQQRCEEAGVTPDVVLPETVVTPSPEEQEGDPLVLVSCYEGIEARGFRQGQLTQSRWWPTLPDQRAWNQYRMLFDLGPVSAPPTALEAVESEGPAVPLRDLLVPFFRAESTLMVVFLALFLVAVAYQAGSMLYATTAISRAEQRIAELNEAVTPVLAARDRALDALDSIESISALHSGPLQLQYLADLLGRLAAEREAGRDVHLMAWDYQPGGVAISVTTENLSAAELLTVFEAIPWLQDIRVGDDTVRGRMRVSAELVRGWRFPAVEPQVADA